ncbi:MAG: TRAP transporter large permease subunit, partial [Thermodesulfobacteriota bacterium]
AAAVETAASMGGLIMPPVMAVAGFVMAEFLNVPYWNVVLRGFSLAFIYYSTLSLSIYLMSVRLMPGEPIEVDPVSSYDQLKTVIFFAGIIFLTILMGALNYGEQLAALYTGIFMFCLLVLAFLLFKLMLRDPVAKKESLLTNIRVMIETHAEMASYLTLLLATLGIMIGLFTVTGFINRMGSMLLKVGEWHIIALILMAWIFGWLVGAGLPPTATYIVLAVIIVEPMRKLGVDPWIAHFFCFLIAVWGELSPPTSLAAAVSARIAEASFMRTMWEALKMCLPITIMTFAIFTRSDFIINPGWRQVADTALVAIACSALTFAMFGRFFRNRGWDAAIRVVYAVVSLLMLFHPNDNVPRMLVVITLPALIYGVVRHKRIAPPKGNMEPQPAG